MGQFSALTSRIYQKSCLVLAVDISTWFTFGFTISTTLHPPGWNLAPGLGSAPTSQHWQYPGWSGWLVTCFESWDTSGKNLASSTLATSWEIPWLSACRWYRNKASVPLGWGLCWRQKGTPAEVPGSGETKHTPSHHFDAQKTTACVPFLLNRLLVKHQQAE